MSAVAVSFSLNVSVSSRCQFLLFISATCVLKTLQDIYNFKGNAGGEVKVGAMIITGDYSWMDESIC